jgi:hypothetical protein
VTVTGEQRSPALPAAVAASAASNLRDGASPAAGVAPPGDDPAGADAASRPDAQRSVEVVPPGRGLVPVTLDPWGYRPYSPRSRSVAP